VQALPHSIPVQAHAGAPPSAVQSGVGCEHGATCHSPLALHVSMLPTGPLASPAPASPAGPVPHCTVLGVHEPEQLPASQRKEHAAPASSHWPASSQDCGASPRHRPALGEHTPEQPPSSQTKGQRAPASFHCPLALHTSGC
jgi:hypothetical protein